LRALTLLQTTALDCQRHQQAVALFIATTYGEPAGATPVRMVLSFMSSTAPQPPPILSVDDEHAEMLAYALGAEGQEKIARAQAEIDAGEGLIADDAYFESLRERRSRRRASR